jgi:hypothetical protein
LLKTEVSNQLKQLFAFQEQRVLLLNEFEIKFKEYLLDAPDFKHAKLAAICKQVSEDMNDVLMRILAIKKTFSPECFNMSGLYGLIEQLQTHEQNKFKLVIQV